MTYLRKRHTITTTQFSFSLKDRLRFCGGE